MAERRSRRWASIHPLLQATRRRNEEVLLIEHSFYSTTPEASANVASSYGARGSSGRTSARRTATSPPPPAAHPVAEAPRGDQGRALGPEGRRTTSASPDLVLEEFPGSAHRADASRPGGVHPSRSAASSTRSGASPPSASTRRRSGGRWNAKMAHALAHCLTVRDRFPTASSTCGSGTRCRTRSGQARAHLRARAGLAMTPRPRPPCSASSRRIPRGPAAAPVHAGGVRAQRPPASSATSPPIRERFIRRPRAG
jgi:hypothetical protein